MMPLIATQGAKAPFFWPKNRWLVATIQDYPVKIVNSTQRFVTIPAGQNYSDPIDLGGATLLGIAIPNYSFSAPGIVMGFFGSTSGNPSDYKLLVDSSNTAVGIGFILPAGGNVHVKLSPVDFVSVLNLKLFISASQLNNVSYELILGPVL